MSLDRYITLGRSGLRVSPLCLGTMTFGEDWGFGASAEDSHRILDRFTERGGNFVDTANAYNNGHSEKIIGDYYRGDVAKRQQLVIATKFFGGMSKNDPNSGGAGRKNIIWSCEESLRRLNTDYIDLYWMHCWDYHTPIEETMRALDDLVSAGKIRHIGFSNTPAWKVTQAQLLADRHSWERVIAVQLEYSLLERTIESDMMPMARELGLGITPWSPLRGGLLSGKYRRGLQQEPSRSWSRGNLDDRCYDVIEVIVQIAEEIGSTPSRVALQWVCAQPGITSPIIGARTLQQLDDNLQSLDVTLSAEHLKRLNELTTPALQFPASYIQTSALFRNAGMTVNGETAPDSAMMAAEKY
ncbi:MAG: Aldo/keto reductase [Verrucomicrobiaceae bacterium]|nr:Aldo/keto reductase [Verrucomicrobiaceae bacterium]